MAAIQHNEELKHYYNQKIAEGKNKMSVINAVKNKLMQRIFAVVRDGRNLSISTGIKKIIFIFFNHGKLGVIGEREFRQAETKAKLNYKCSLLFRPPHFCQTLR